MNPLEIFVFTPMPESWGLCTTCEAFLARADLERSQDESFDSFPREWMEEFKLTSTIILDISERFGSKVLIRLYDPRSFPGIFKAIQHRAFSHPTYVIGKRKVVGNDEETLNRIIGEAVDGGNQK